MFTRPIVRSGGQQREMRNGDGYVANPRITTVTADAVDTVTVAKIAGGIVQYTGLTAGRNFTTDTAANIIAAFPDMDIGDCLTFKVSITTAFAGTWVAGAGVTLAGRATTPASSSTEIVIEKLSSTTVKWTVL